MIRNLGQVAAIYIGSSAPRNTNLIWLDNTVVPFMFRAYDGSAWSEIATHKWVRAYVDGWLVTLPPRQLADDGDYMLINSNNVNYKITVKDFVKSAVGNPLDFKGIIRVSADFPNPSTLESGDMYVIITSPVGGTVTDPYSGKTFEDSEKIVWDEVTQSWESLGKIDITVDLTTSYSETEVTIHSSAGKETTIQGATDQLAGVMLPGQYSWLQALSNGSIVPGDPSPLTPLTPAHKHNYNDIINRLVSQQGTGESTIDPMSQKATTDALNLKFDKASVLQVSGAATDKVMSQKAVTDALKTLSDDFNNKLTNYLPLAGGTMKGNIRFPIGNGIVCNDVAGTAAYVVLRTRNANNSTRMYVGTVNFPTYISSTASDLIHDRNGSPYLLWDSYNLTNPVTYTTNTYNHATLTNKDGQYFTYIKAGTNGLLPHSKVTLASRGSGFLGTSDQSFDAAYINHLHTNKVTFGDVGLFIDGQSGNSDHRGIGFYTSQNAACPVYVGSLCVSDGYANSAPNIPTNGIYSKGNIYTSSGITFNNNTWTNDLAPNRTYGGYLQVLDAYNASSAGGPTNYGTVLQVNSRNAHWANQLWFSGGTEASKNGLYYRHMSYNETTYGEWHRLLTNKDVNILPASYNNNPNSLPTNQIFYAETQGVAGTPTSNGLLFSVQGDDEGIQLWAGANRTELYYRTKWTAFGNWIKLATTSDIGNYLPLTGGIVTGDIKLNTEAALYTAANSGSGYSYYKTISYDNDKGIILGASNTSIKIQSSDPRIYHIYKGTEYEIYSTNNLPTPVYAPGKVAGSLTPIYNNFFYINDSSYKVATIDNSYSFPKIYSPTSAGTSGQILQSTGGVPEWVNAPSVVGNFVSKSGDTMTGALTMSSRRNNVVIDVVGGGGNSWDQGAGALSVQIPNDSGQTPLLLARRSGATINTTTLSERLLDIALLDTGTIFRVGMSGVNALELEVTSFTNKVGIGKLFGKQIATTDQIPSIPSISISNSGSGNAVTAISASGHTLTVTKGATYLTSSSLDGYATQTWVNNKGYLTSHQTIYNLTFQAGTFAAKTFDPNGAAATVNIPTKTSHITNDSGFITSSALNGYATQAWVNSQNFVKSTSTKKVTDIQPVDALPATQASGVLYLVFG